MTDSQELKRLVETQPVTPLVNKTANWRDPNRCGVIFSEEYREGTIRVHIGNMFAGITHDCEKAEYSSLEELFAIWRID